MSIQTSVIDNQDGNTLQEGIRKITEASTDLCIATAYFSLDALTLVADNLHNCNSVRILFGDDADKTQRLKLLAQLRSRSDEDLLKERAVDPTLTNLQKVQELFRQGKIQARCYTAKKFHAKTYIATRTVDPYERGILGSGNFTRPGLTQNIELNVKLSDDQAPKVKAWFEERWEEAVLDDVTEEVEAEIHRQIKLYDPYAIFIRSLLAWGDWVQGREQLPELGVVGLLDPHQEDAYRQALKILDRESGVMVCDGVGLGKSFVALALMEHFLSKGRRAFLIAPKAILTASWENYLQDFLDRYRRGYQSLVHEPMTWFGFDPSKPINEEKLRELKEFTTQAQVVVIDESHNFRKTDAQRYANLLSMLQEGPLGKKLVILLTATPINTNYTDLSAQFRLITQDKGTIGGIPIERYQKDAVSRDQEDAKKKLDQPSLDYSQGHDYVGLLKLGMDAVAIQRSRETCKMLADKKGKSLRFPDREPIQTVEYELGPMFKDVVQHANSQFQELARFLAAYRKEVQRASGEKEAQKRLLHVKIPRKGLRLSAYLTDLYRIDPTDSLREAQVESGLAKLVFTNVIKQLESSPVAFQGILQALGAGLCARLQHTADKGYLPSDEIRELAQEHSSWIGADLRHPALDDEDDDLDEEAVDASGGEMDDWLARALRVNSVRKGLAEFGVATHDVKTWRKHIESDLDILRDIHERTVQARAISTDQKLADIADRIKEQRSMGRKVLVFTQSRRTAEYLERELADRFGSEVARMDASIGGDRRKRILHAFSPKYNPAPEQLELELEPLNILVSTDVLSEGVNLQEAGCILNYDIHWNPVRLIQRIGRVDRRLREDDPGHTFAILNVVPPPEIEEIIELVGTVEGRKRKIIKVLGLDQAFFSATDPAGTLHEFNSELEGNISARDQALGQYDELIAQFPAEIDRAQSAPRGAFGIWKGAPGKGRFGLFRLELKPTATENDQKRFEKLIGHPVLALELDDRFITDPADVLSVLMQTQPKESSGKPHDLDALPQNLKKLRDNARQALRDFNLTQGCTLSLECWMELEP